MEYDRRIDEELLKNKDIVVTGGGGFLGRHVVEELAKKTSRSIVVPTSVDCDLRIFENCIKIVKDKDVVIHLAGQVGGIGFNKAHGGEIFYNNMVMGVNIMESARVCNVKKVVIIGTVCSYPRVTQSPFKEEDLWLGYPEETNAPYGVAKRALSTMVKAYKDQYGLNGIFLMPVNLYGPGDNFNPESSHVIPALIKKFWEAKTTGASSVKVWGTGKATREFLYVKDAAKGIVLATLRHNSESPVNLGSGMEISIKDLAELIKNKVDYGGKIEWDTSKPDGQPRRILDTIKAEKQFGFRATTTFDQGLEETINWYIQKHSIMKK